MKHCIRSFYIVLTCMFLCCNDRVTGKDLMPEMLQTDSVQIIYFKAPDEPRYFLYTSVSDPSFINYLIDDLTTETQPKNSCIKEGKIYCYRKGEIFNTVFFAYMDKCIFLRYIKNGNLYYFKMSEKVKNELRNYKALAKEPIPDE